MIVGIAGPSCSGKSSIANMVCAATRAPLVKLDGKWVKGVPKVVVNGYRSYERPESYDHQAVVDEIEAHAAHERLVVAEGFLLFTYPAILERCTLRFFVDVPHEELVRRRLARAAAGGDPVWGQGNGGLADADRGWLAHGGVEWERFGASQATVPGVVILDGTQPVEHNANAVLATVLGHHVTVPPPGH